MREKKIYALAGELNTALRYAVLGDSERFLKHKHAWKAWHTLKEFGCSVIPVAKGITRLDGIKVYPNLASLQDKIDVVVPCLRPEKIPDLIAEVKACGAKIVWFQEQNWTSEFQTQADSLGIQVVKGCILKHKIYARPFGFLNPCYWHGLHSPKVPKKKYR
ncbi:CoA-binding protein [Desulfitobacterium sp.]|uniref:CoA-binding protein n=1 Tax=Desulfitobacterium sp. TaxID=49981 RepID=UPI002B818C5C|nr:CoA-binding protein [Desulfitobacterium sp.]HVJ48409.1 CoA-binding protein [Desulfitobacterium sp.]